MRQTPRKAGALITGAALLTIAMTTPALASDTTELLKDIATGTTASNPDRFLELDGTVYFAASDGVNGLELWKTDGTTAGTVLVKDINAGASSSAPADFVAYDGEVYFSAYDSTNGTELWKTDGTAGGTVLVKNIGAGVNAGSPRSFMVLGGSLYFVARNGDWGVWKTDGTTAGTTQLSLGISGAAMNSNTDLYAYGDDFLIRTFPSPGRVELVRSDGTAAGTESADPVGGEPFQELRILGQAGDIVVFRGRTQSRGIELWKTEGTASSTVLLKEFNPGRRSTTITGGLELDGELFFQAQDRRNGSELWKTDGTTSGTTLVKDINPGSAASGPGQLTLFDDELYFTATTAADGNELWKTDGTTGGTVQVADVRAGSGDGRPRILAATSDTLYFGADDGTNGTELWGTDGTSAGTALVADIETGSESSSPRGGVILGDSLVFTADTDALGRELWVVGPGEIEFDLSVRTDSLWSPNNRFLDVGLEVDFPDGRPTGSTLSVDVYSDEAARSRTADDAQVQSGDLSLRRARLGNGDGRVYLIVVTVTSASGAEFSEAITVTVPKSRSRRHLDDVAEQAEEAQDHFDDNDGDIPSGFRRVSNNAAL